MAASQPKKAAKSIMPSMPMLTTPARSQNTPESAPNVSGVATAIVVASILVMINKGGCLDLSNHYDHTKENDNNQGDEDKNVSDPYRLLASPTAGKHNPLAF